MIMINIFIVLLECLLSYHIMLKEKKKFHSFVYRGTEKYDDNNFSIFNIFHVDDDALDPFLIIKKKHGGVIVV